MSERKKNILRDVAVYSISKYISQFLGFFIAVLIRNFLGPSYMGMWSLMRVVFSFAAYSEFGVMQAADFKIPLYNGRGDKDKAEEVQDVVFSFLIVTSTLVSFLILVASLVLKERMPKEVFMGFLLFPVLFLSQRLYAYYVTLLRANKRFIILSKVGLLDSIINLILVILLVSRFKLYGLYAVSILLPLIDICYMWYAARLKLRFKIVRDKISECIKYGFPIFLSSISMLMFYSVDSIMIAKMIGLVSLGYYSIAIMVKTYANEFAKSFEIVISPYLMEDYGKTDDISKVGHSIVKYTEIISCMIACVLGFLYLVFPVFVYYVMPKFQEGISPMKWALLCTFFMVSLGQVRHLLIMKERQVTVMKMSIAVIALNIVINYAAIKSGFGITGVAASSSIAAFLFFLGLSIVALKYIDRLTLFHFLTRVLVLPLCLLLAILALEHFVIYGILVVELAVKVFFFLLASLFVGFYINRRTNIVTIVLRIIMNKIKVEMAVIRS